MATIMTWNVENLFRPTSGDSAGQRREYQQKVAALAAVVTGVDPDLLAVQEVGGPDEFGDLLAALGAGWTGELSQHPDVRGIRVGWLGRTALSDVEQIVDLPAELSPVRVGDDGQPDAQTTTMGRGGLAVTATTRDGSVVRVATCHLKSKLLTFPGASFTTHDEDLRARYGVYALDRRAAEAATMREWATRELTADATANVLVCGDFNDTPEAATTQLLLGPPGSTIGTPGFDQPDQGDAQRLWDVAPVIPPALAYSRINDGRRELIDHVLVSHALVRRLSAATTVTSGETPSVSANPRTAAGGSAPSDHRALVATFTAP